MGNHTIRSHKSLVNIGGKPLIKRVIKQLKEIGIERICVIVGHQANKIRKHLSDDCEFIVNKRYAETNSIYSLWLARNWVKGPFLLLNCDVLAHPHVFQKLVETPGTALAYDSRSGDREEHMKVRFFNGKLKSICKSLSLENNDGENVGILKFDREGASQLFRNVKKAIKETGELTWAPAALKYLAVNYPVKGVDIAGLPWTEIDFPEDLENATATVWPAISKQIKTIHSEHVAHIPQFVTC